MSILRKSIEIAGRTLTLETGRMAKQASGAIFASYGDTQVLSAVTVSDQPREGIDFFPLQVEFEEKMYAVGKIPGGFIKREGRPAEKAILSSRLIDRPLRPLFPKGFRNDVQVVNTILSVDQDNAPDMVAMIAASCALHISKIPFNGPIAGVTVGLIYGQYIFNPTVEQEELTEMHVSVAGTADAVMMVEAGAWEIPESVILEGIMAAHEEIKRIVAFIEEFRAEALELGLASPKIEFVKPAPPEELEAAVRELACDKFSVLMRKCCDERTSKEQREAEIAALEAEVQEALAERFPDDAAVIGDVLYTIQKETMRRLIAKDKVRIDGRLTTEVRPITCEVGVLARTHGSSLFTRGQTQILNALTLGMIGEQQKLDGVSPETSKRYMHQYNFPPYSVGEARPLRSPGRREIGHGALAERALIPVIPDEETFPYALRLVSEAIESNGSTSMGSVCASTLSLMDAGVPITAPVAGCAMGLIKEGDDVTVLTDIQGMEDFLGDMDFKVAGTEKGVTAIQMDIKIPGIDREILTKALAQAREGRLFIMGKMLECLPEPRAAISKYAPRIITIQIDPDKIRDVIGSGGKVIKKIVEVTGADIDVEEDGRVFISSVDGTMGEKAQQIIESIVAVPEVGKIYQGTVVDIKDFGCFVEIIPGVMGNKGRDGMVHISELAKRRVEKCEDVCKVGDVMWVKVLNVDPATGKVKLSRKQAMADLGLSDK